MVSTQNSFARNLFLHDPLSHHLRKKQAQNEHNYSKKEWKEPNETDKQRNIPLALEPDARWDLIHKAFDLFPSFNH